MGAAELNGDISFTLLEPLGPYKRALIEIDVGETINHATADTITLSDKAYRVNTIKAVTAAHVFATGVACVYSYATHVLTKTAGGDTRDVVEILFV